MKAHAKACSRETVVRQFSRCVHSGARTNTATQAKPSCPGAHLVILLLCSPTAISIAVILLESAFGVESPIVAL